MFHGHPTRPAALITIDRAGRISDCDTRAGGCLDWSEGGMLNTPVARLIGPGSARSAFMAWLSAASTASPTRAAASSMRTALLAGDGRVVEAIVHLEPSRLYADTRFLFVYVPEATQPALPPWSRATRRTVRCRDAA